MYKPEFGKEQLCCIVFTPFAALSLSRYSHDLNAHVLRHSEKRGEKKNKKHKSQDKEKNNNIVVTTASDDPTE